MLTIERLYQAWEHTQTATTIPLILIPAGTITLIFGDNVSSAFTNLGGDLIIRILGALIVIGGSLVIAGTIKRDALLEVLGLAFTALGSAIYGAGVILGLGILGSVAGIGYFAITLALLGRITLILKAARTASKP